MFIKLNANNDTNGNSRILFALVSEGGAIVQAWHEGGRDYNAVPEEHREAARKAVTVPTTPAFYREIKKSFVRG